MNKPQSYKIFMMGDVEFLQGHPSVFRYDSREKPLLSNRALYILPFQKNFKMSSWCRYPYTLLTMRSLARHEVLVYFVDMESPLDKKSIIEQFDSFAGKGFLTSKVILVGMQNDPSNLQRTKEQLENNRTTEEELKKFAEEQAWHGEVFIISTPRNREEFLTDKSSFALSKFSIDEIKDLQSLLSDKYFSLSEFSIDEIKALQIMLLGLDNETLFSKIKAIDPAKDNYKEIYFTQDEIGEVKEKLASLSKQNTTDSLRSSVDDDDEQEPRTMPVKLKGIDEANDGQLAKRLNEKFACDKKRFPKVENIDLTQNQYKYIPFTPEEIDEMRIVLRSCKMINTDIGKIVRLQRKFVTDSYFQKLFIGLLEIRYDIYKSNIDHFENACKQFEEHLKKEGCDHVQKKIKIILNDFLEKLRNSENTEWINVLKLEAACFKQLENLPIPTQRIILNTVVGLVVTAVVTAITAMLAFGFILGAWIGPAAFISALTAGSPVTIAVAASSSVLGACVGAATAYGLFKLPTHQHLKETFAPVHECASAFN